jgi:hypothetical protein
MQPRLRPPIYACTGSWYHGEVDLLCLRCQAFITHRNSFLHTVCLSRARILLVNPTVIVRLIAPVSQIVYYGSIG